MARAPQPTAGEQLRTLADQLYEIGVAYDAAERDTPGRHSLNHMLEEIAGQVRAVPRGRGFT